MRGKTAEMSQFRPHFHIFFWGGLLCPSPITNPGQICQQAVDPRSTRIRQISFESVYCVTFQGQKTQQFKENFDIWGTPVRCTDPLLPMTAKCVLERTHSIHLRVKSVYFVALWRRKTPNFAVFGLQHFVVSPVGGNLRMLNTGAQLQTIPYPMASNRLCSATCNTFMVKSGTQTDIQKRDGQADKKLDVFFGCNPSPTKLGMVIEDLEHVLAPPKLLVVRRTVQFSPV